ncbi:flagellar basal body L-ring protein FlgH [Tropicimonas sp. IMCC34011]|uniref:flagellar basal body L-ring protein FlgH n=1 Tax=Tropicimonas sp. IMCC34011 TaxID=2248759 RepID=UPI000E27A49A|nr:flagellar basal body L-ring protein FlgH [Tropicimonas sp. IMCC34011]
MRAIAVILLCLAAAGCNRVGHIGRAPDFTSNSGNYEHHAMVAAPLATPLEPEGPVDRASLWSRDRQSLLGDRRAGAQGDILTVVVEIDEKAEISNSTERSRSGSEDLAISSLVGIPQRVDPRLPLGASLADAVDATSSSSSAGDGSVRRNEKLTLRVAATVTEVLPNGALRVEGSQEVRVNFEIRELIVSGYVRPEDISRQNEITYDKIASARISYGGRGQITDVQQPRIGQQIADIVLPF